MDGPGPGGLEPALFAPGPVSAAARRAPSAKALCAGFPSWRRADGDDPLRPACVPHEDPYLDLRDQKIYALVYYGRRDYAEILNVYLERNLRKNGGVIDTVLFALVKYTDVDLMYLGELQRRNPESYVVPPITGGGWDTIWQLVQEPGAIYIKIDDDILYIQDGAIPELVREKRRGRFLFVSANVVNHGIMSAIHQEFAAMPALQPEADSFRPWRQIGDINHDANFRVEHTFYSDCVWRRWECAALVHESLLHAIKNNRTCAYDFGVFDFHSHGYANHFDGIGRYLDWNDNFFALQTEDFSDIDWDRVATDDEATMATWHPKQRDHHAGALGRALVSHFTFSSQEKGLRANTSLLLRYQELALPMAFENAKHYGGYLQPWVNMQPMAQVAARRG